MASFGLPAIHAANTLVMARSEKARFQEERSGNNSIVARIFGWELPLATMKKFLLIRFIATLLGACFALVGMIGVWKGFETRRWATAPAKIVKSQRIGSGSRQSSEIATEFRVDSRLLLCGRVRMERDNSPRDVEEFPLGSKTTVSYDPKVERCVIAPGVSGGSVVFVATGIACFGLAAYAHSLVRQSSPRTGGAGARRRKRDRPVGSEKRIAKRPNLRILRRVPKPHEAVAFHVLE